MKRIPLTQGKEALVDDCDYEYLMQWKWCARKDRDTFYAGRSRPNVPMHRVIAERAGMKIDGLEVDHWNHDGLDNQLSNLRPATKSQNQSNRGPTKNNTSGYKGVDWHEGRWRASIQVAQKRTHLGHFDDKHDAARAYNEAVVKFHKEFARLNRIADRRVRNLRVEIERRSGERRKV